MSKDNTNVSKDGYITNLRTVLALYLFDIAENDKSEDEFINFIVDEIYASYKRGVQAGSQPRKKAYRKGKPGKASLSR